MLWLTILLPIAVVLWILGLAATIDVIRKGRSAEAIMAWSVALLLLPVVALPFYALFGERRFQGYVRARRRGLRTLDAELREFQSHLKPFVAKNVRADLRSLVRLARMPLTAGNALTLLIDGDAMYEQMLRSIDEAKRYVLAHFYIYRDDETGRAFRDRLIAARKRGVSVHFMYDELGCLQLPGSYLACLSDAGCAISGFRTIPSRRRFLRLNFRNHRKIVVVDGRVGFVGGINVGDEYRGRGELGHWRDTHLRLEGPAVQCLQLAFTEDWYWALRQVPPNLEWEPSQQASDEPVLIYLSGPADELESGALLFGQLINLAQERLWIATPYFVPDEFVLNSLHLAALRGVDVRILVPGEKADSWIAAWAGDSYFDELLTSKVQISRYAKGFMHQKVVLADDVTAIGTANLDNRSMRINFEVTALVESAGFADQARAMLEEDFASSVPVTPADWAGKPMLTQLRARLARLAAPLL